MKNLNEEHSIDEVGNHKYLPPRPISGISSLANITLFSRLILFLIGLLFRLKLNIYILYCELPITYFGGHLFGFLYIVSPPQIID